MTRVVIADDHLLFVQALQAALTSAGLEVVGTTEYGAEVVALVEATHPDVVLLDLHIPDRSGLDCLAALRERMPEVKVIILSGADDQSSINSALAMGAVCYVGKAVDAQDLAATIRIMATEAPIYTGGGSRVAAPSRASVAETGSSAADAGLTRRELEILQLVATGMTNGEVARKLWVSEQTIKFHLSNIYGKLEVGNRTQAAAKARTLGLTSEWSGKGSPAAKTSAVGASPSSGGPLEL